ncbi:hypothetical protein LGQ02_20050 [Bacillus shivajii]|uniref:hypothetical protein n=1 Tax=Bacillus shivajii TaxID=1983719 RepID=UPI001CFBED52|nr:hypothetical protein [Bacillus shivajii]UCZ53039.1 hypothetical protein LGQ02_20050 [Bacillus shivajii]
MLKYTLSGLALLFLLLSSTACTEMDPPEAQGLGNQGEARKDWGESLFGPGPINYGNVTDRPERHTNVSELNTTGTSYRSPEASRQTLADDQDIMETIIYEMDRVEPGMVIITGGQAWVNVMFERGMEQQEKQDLIEEIEDRLYDANPRYHYRIIENTFQ